MSDRVSRADAVDLGRLQRGAVRAIRQIGPGEYAVQGTKERVYYVNLNLDTPCDCADAQYRGRGCLHELAARLQARDPKVMQTLGELLLKRETIMREVLGEDTPRKAKRTTNKETKDNG